MPLLDELDPLVQRVGAVNTILNRDGKLFGYNTDVEGFLRALREDGGFEPRGARVAIAGAGGAARAVVIALADAGAAYIVILNRTLDRAERLIADVRPHDRQRLAHCAAGHRPESWAKVAACRGAIGKLYLARHRRAPKRSSSAVPADLIRPEMLVYDLVYRPTETRLLRDARSRGARTLGGLPMLIYQGAASFKIWTGRDAPVDVMFAAARKALGVRLMLQWAILGIFIAFLFFAYIIIQGTRAALAWRDAADSGDMKVIQDIVEDAIKSWAIPEAPEAGRRRGLARHPEHARSPASRPTSCASPASAESDYKMVDGRWVEIRNPLQEGVAITAQAPPTCCSTSCRTTGRTRIQIDVYTDYRDDAGRTRPPVHPDDPGRPASRREQRRLGRVDRRARSSSRSARSTGLSENRSPAANRTPLTPPEDAQTPDEIIAAAQSRAAGRGARMTQLRFLTAGESHGQALVAILEGIPAGLEITEDYIAEDMHRRQGGYGRSRRQQLESTARRSSAASATAARSAARSPWSSPTASGRTGKK